MLNNQELFPSRSKIACELGGIRTGKQCRERYQNHLRPDINKSEWSPEEDKIVIDLKEKLGTQWSKIALELPGRSGIKKTSNLIGMRNWKKLCFPKFR